MVTIMVRKRVDVSIQYLELLTMVRDICLGRKTKVCARMIHVPGTVHGTYSVQYIKLLKIKKRQKDDIESRSRFKIQDS